MAARTQERLRGRGEVEGDCRGGSTESQEAALGPLPTFSLFLFPIFQSPIQVLSLELQREATAITEDQDAQARMVFLSFI